MWKLIKWLFFLAIVAIIVLSVTGYKIRGKTIGDYGRAIVGAKTYDEGMKDMRSLVGEAIKAVGEAVSPEPTSEEKKELEGVIQKELEGTKSTMEEPSKPQEQPVKKQ